MAKLRNQYYLLRHGQAVSNVKGLCSSWPETFRNPLTAQGRATVKESVKRYHGLPIDVIVASDLLRTRQTALIAARILKLKPKFDKRLREIDFGVFNGKPKKDFDGHFKEEYERINKKARASETYREVGERAMDFLRDAERKFQGKNILLVSHECPLWIMEAKVKGIPLEKILKGRSFEEKMPNGQIKKLTHSHV